jgi:hypothetical protein
MSSDKTADRPHNWTVALSLTAVFVSLASATLSYLSFNETRHNNAVNVQTSRAYLSVSSPVLDGSLFARDDWKRGSAKGFVTVVNSGRTAARQVDTLLDLNPPRKQNWLNIARFAEIAPGSSKTVRVLVLVGSKHDLTSLGDSGEYAVTVQLIYEDGLHIERQEQAMSFCLSYTSPTQKAVTLYPCDLHFTDDESSHDTAK